MKQHARSRPLWPLLVFCLILPAFSLHAQDLDRIEQKDLLRINGSVGTNQTLYFNEGIEARRLPYIFLYSGNLNIDFLGITSTLSFIYTNPQFSKNISNPFNSIAYHPRYKWVAAHIGRFGTNYSPYTLNGHLFDGGGVDLTPTKFPLHASVCFGRFLKPIEPDEAYLKDTAKVNPLLLAPGLGPSFLRWGGALKLQYVKNDFRLGVIAFRAWDDANSLHALPAEDKLKPQENNVLSLSLTKNFFKRFHFSGEFAYSGINKNTQAGEAASSGSSRLLLLQPKEGISFYKAFKTSLSYDAKLFVIGLGYERIDPEYRTFGTYFFINDIENTTIDLSTQLFKQRLSLNCNLGLQRDDLARTKETNMRRTIANVNLNYAASQRLNFNASYSNFRTFSNTRGLAQQISATSQYDYIDTLQYRQISKNINVGASYALFVSEKCKQNLNGNVTYQSSSDVQGQKQTGGSTFYNGFVGYNVLFVHIDFSLTLNANASRNDFAQFQTTILGPSLLLTKGFFQKKLRGNGSVTYLQTEGSTNGRIITYRAGLSYNMFRKHQLSLNAIVLDNNSKAIRTMRYREYTITFSYSYHFNVFESRKKAS